MRYLLVQPNFSLLAADAQPYSTHFLVSLGMDPFHMKPFSQIGYTYQWLSQTIIILQTMHISRGACLHPEVVQQIWEKFS